MPCSVNNNFKNFFGKTKRFFLSFFSKNKNMEKDGYNEVSNNRCGDENNKFFNHHQQQHPCSKTNNKYSYFNNQETTLEAIKNADRENKKFARSLKKQGHRCVNIFETIPTRIGWCQKEICVGPNYFD